MDNKLDLFVQNEGPHLIMNLLLEEQVNKIMFGEITNFNDFEDWLCCVNQDEERKNEQFEVIKGKDVSNIFQPNIESNSHNINEINVVFDEGKRWAEIKGKIKVNPNLDYEKANQLWELLD